MGLTLVGSGVYETWNLLAHAATTLGMETGVASSTHPLSFLKDGNSAKPFRAAADVTDLAIRADLGSSKNVQLLTIHGHTLASSITYIELRWGSSSNFGLSTLLAKAVPFYHKSSMYIWVPAGQSARWWWIVFKGTNGGTPIILGEATLSVPKQLVTKAQSLRVDHHENHVRHELPSGRKEVFERFSWEVRYVLSAFKGSLAGRDDVAENVYRESRGDLRPILFLPRAPSSLLTGGGGDQTFADTEKVVVLGHLDPPELIEDLSWPKLAAWSIGVQEDGFTEPLA